MTSPTPTRQDPRYRIRQGSEVSHEVSALDGRPKGGYDICLDRLPAQYNWVAAEAERLCDQGALPICYCGEVRFICIHDFASAFAADTSTRIDDHDLPTQLRFSHLSMFYMGEEPFYPESLPW